MKKTIVGIDIRFALSKPRGIGQYIKNLILNLNVKSDQYQYFFLEIKKI